MKFTILNREILLKGRAFEIHRLDMRLPDGQTHAFDLVQHNNSVSILPLDIEGNIWFVRQYRVGAEEDLLELPAGVLEDNEDPQTGASREVREETGMAARKIIKLGEGYLAPGYASELMFFYLGTDLYPDPLPGDEDEFITLVKIPAAEAYHMARNGEIRDSKTLAAMLLAENHIHR